MTGTYKALREHTHTQLTPSTTWEIVHNCDGIPVVDVFVTYGGNKQKIMPKDVTIPTSTIIGTRLWGWGDNWAGQLGDNTITETSSPVQTIAGGTNWEQVSPGESHTAAIKTDGTLWTWGYNYDGQLGDGTDIDKSSPVQTIAGGTDWKQVAGGKGGHHTAAIKTDGTLWIWGSNYYGELGIDTIDNKSSPVQTVAGGTNWKEVTGGNFYTAAIKTDGTLWMWGINNRGQLGDNTTIDKSSPIQTVAGGTNWKQVACSDYHTSAIKTDGTLWTWGRNYYGQLGDNTTIDKSSPIQTVAGGTDWKEVTCGGSFTAAIKTDGTLWLWGVNESGYLGDGTDISRSSPVQTVAGGTNWKQVSGGGHHTAAIKTDGTLWLWGNNTSSQLGVEYPPYTYSSPIQTVAGGTDWKQVACAEYGTMAITEGSGAGAPDYNRVTLTFSSAVSGIAKVVV